MRFKKNISELFLPNLHESNRRFRDIINLRVYNILQQIIKRKVSISLYALWSVSGSFNKKERN